VQPLIFWVVAVEQQKRIYEKWKVIDNRKVKRSVIINLIDRYAEILVEESGHGGIPIEAVASFGLAAWQGEELADGSTGLILRRISALRRARQPLSCPLIASDDRSK
jgi:hypothetical protein